MLSVAVGSCLYSKVSDLDELPPTLVDEVEQFFINYNKMRGRVFKPIARCGASEVMKLMKLSVAQVKRKKH